MSIVKAKHGDKQEQARASAHVSSPQRKAGSPDAETQTAGYYDIASSPRQTAQAKVINKLFPETVQRQEDEESQATFPLQKSDREEKTPPGGSRSGSGIPESVQTRMESVLNTSLSDVKVHTNSGKASEVGALAFTQGSDIHVAPGHYNPDTSAGKQLLGHELTHVAQQKEGRVKPTGSIGGMPLNDSPALEKEADTLGSKAV